MKVSASLLASLLIGAAIAVPVLLEPRQLTKYTSALDADGMRLLFLLIDLVSQ